VGRSKKLLLFCGIIKSFPLSRLPPVDSDSGNLVSFFSTPERKTSSPLFHSRRAIHFLLFPLVFVSLCKKDRFRWKLLLLSRKSLGIDDPFFFISPISRSLFPPPIRSREDEETSPILEMVFFPFFLFIRRGDGPLFFSPP